MLTSVSVDRGLSSFELTVRQVCVICAETCSFACCGQEAPLRLNQLLAQLYGSADCAGLPHPRIASLTHLWITRHSLKHHQTAQLCLNYHQTAQLCLVCPWHWDSPMDSWWCCHGNFHRCGWSSGGVRVWQWVWFCHLLWGRLCGLRMDYLSITSPGATIRYIRTWVYM